MNFLNKKITEIKLNNNVQNPYELRLLARNLAKEKLNASYFYKFKNKYKIKNFGCLIFGQPDTWKGIIGFKILDPIEGTVEVYYEKKRAELITNNDMSLEDIEYFLNKIIDTLEESGYIIRLS
jgi:hypothetical protein